MTNNHLTKDYTLAALCSHTLTFHCLSDSFFFLGQNCLPRRQSTESPGSATLVDGGRNNVRLLHSVTAVFSVPGSTFLTVPGLEPDIFFGETVALLRNRSHKPSMSLCVGWTFLGVILAQSIRSFCGACRKLRNTLTSSPDFVFVTVSYLPESLEASRGLRRAVIVAAD